MNDPRSSRESAVLATVRCMERLADVGFPEPGKLIRAMPRLPFLEPNKVPDLLDFLKRRGSKKPHWVLLNAPGIIPADLTAMEAKLEGFNTLGFADPISLADRCPSFLTYSVERVRGRLRTLRRIGCADPIKVIEGFGYIPGYSSLSLKRQLRDLHARSFDVVRLVNAMPAVFGLSMDRIDERLRILAGIGVENPVRLFNRLPQLVDCSPERLTNTIQVLRSLTHQWAEIIVGVPNVLRYSEATIRVILPIALKRCSKTDPLPLSQIGGLFYFHSAMIAATDAAYPDATLPELLRHLRKAQWRARKEKVRLLHSDPLPDTPPIPEP